VKGIVEAWFPGQEDGNATAAVLFGDVNPSGKLPITFPKAQRDIPIRTTAQWPGINGHSSFSEQLLVGYRWYQAKGITPLFPFGFGLSYTNFRYSGLSVRSDATGAQVSFKVTNAGRRAGAEVAQLYVGDPPSTGEPPRQLKGYAKVELAPGETRQVTLALDERAFSYWNAATHAWTVAPGCYGLFVGGSSADEALAGSIARGGGACAG
jgi:beta-glucosidase